MPERSLSTLLAPDQAHVVRRHTSKDGRVVEGTITHGGPNQYACGFYPTGSHGGCAGCGGLGWYVEGTGKCSCYQCRAKEERARLVHVEGSSTAPGGDEGV